MWLHVIQMWMMADTQRSWVSSKSDVLCFKSPDKSSKVPCDEIVIVFRWANTGGRSSEVFRVDFQPVYDCVQRILREILIFPWLTWTLYLFNSVWFICILYEVSPKQSHHSKLQQNNSNAVKVKYFILDRGALCTVPADTLTVSISSSLY